MKILNEDINEEIDLNSSHSNKMLSSLNLELPKIDAEKNDDYCQICYDNNEEKVLVGPCLHSFCKDCLSKYLEYHISIAKARKLFDFS